MADGNHQFHETRYGTSLLQRTHTLGTLLFSDFVVPKSILYRNTWIEVGNQMAKFTVGSAVRAKADGTEYVFKGHGWEIQKQPAQAAYRHGDQQEQGGGHPYEIQKQPPQQ